VKDIHFIRIGRSARGQAGKVQSIAANLAAESGVPGSGSSADVSAPAPESGATPPGSASGAEGAAAIVVIDPAEGRYVDDKYEALPAAKLRSALTSTSADDALLAVAKRMPVRMRLLIDQRKLNVLIAQCGNSKLPLEVRQVRLNREPAPLGGDVGGGGYAMAGSSDMPGSGSGSFSSFGGSSFGGSGSFGGSFGGPGSGSDMPSSGSFGGSFGAAGAPGGIRAGSQTGDSSIDPNQIPVELYGVVYIYNPVNNKQLGIEEPAASAQPGPVAGTPAPPATPPTTTTTSTPATPPAPTGTPLTAAS